MPAPAAARPARGRSRPPAGQAGDRVRVNPNLRVKRNPAFEAWRNRLPAVLPPPTILK